jgi:predicted NBD/HSP70 family sugar kinase
VLAIEVGGSSVQATVIEDDGTFRIVPLAEHRNGAWCFAAPGFVDGDSVRGAHHLHWMDVRASEEPGMNRPPLLGMNDAEASALGEWVLQGEPMGRKFYVVMGTGMGAMSVEEGRVTPVEFGHLPGFGPNFCGGCMNYCLDAQIGGHALPTPLADPDIDFIVRLLQRAIVQEKIEAECMVLAGGANRTYPQIRERLSLLVASAAPAGLKSAAPFGLKVQLGRLQAGEAPQFD